MAKGRMLKKVISKSRRLSELKSDSARLLYTWLLPHLDVEGRFYADPEIIKGSVVPRIKNMTPQRIKSYLQDMAKNELIFLYEVDGDSYLEVRKFESHQSLRKDREAKSTIPVPYKNSGITPGVLPESSRHTPAEDKLSKYNTPPIIPPKHGGEFRAPKRNFKKETQKVLDYLNKKFNRKFIDGTQITNRLKQGGTVAQCKQIIDTKSHDPYFQENSHLFSPKTLFRPSHWDTYLNQKPSDFSRDGPEPVVVPYKPPELPDKRDIISTDEIRQTRIMLRKGGSKQ